MISVSEQNLSKSSQVVTDIVEQEICCGCGVCAGACPFHNLKMAWRDNGDRVPMFTGKCPPGCRLCLKICPFGPQSASEDRLAQARFSDADGSRHDATIGHYIEMFVGYSLSGNHRAKGASGGMATWLLEFLLSKGLVDAVVCVGMSKGCEHLFEYQIISDTTSLQATASSRYYPVDVADAVSLINKENQEARYAVVGLPCVLKGLHLAMETMPRLRRRIVYTFGLVCGHLPNRFYTEYLSCLSGISSEALSSANYRLKEGTSRAGNYIFQAISKNGRTGMAIPFSKISDIWRNGFFQVNACNYCDDVFAEVADAVFMDAWLPQYTIDTRGHSLMVIRHPDLVPLFSEGVQTGRCHIEPISLQAVIDSQKGVINNKRKLLAARLYAADLHGRKRPNKRFPPDKDSYRRHRSTLKAHLAVQQSSKALWPTLGTKSIATFRLYMLWPCLPLLWNHTVARACRLLKRPSLILRLTERF